MRAYVFTDRALAPVAARFVWLSVNTEKESNQAFLDHFPIESWPTLLVLDPKTEQPIRKWLGSATAPELVARLDEVADAVAAKGQGAAPTAGGSFAADAALAKASQLGAKGDTAGAISAYQEALQAAPSNWAQRPQALEGLIFGLQSAGKNDACVQLALDQMGSLPKGTSLANVAATGLSCAAELPKGDPLAAREPELDAKVAELAKDDTVPLLADDRSGLYDTLVYVRKDRGDVQGAKEAAGQWAAFLEGQAAKAKTPQARAVFDSHRLGAYLELGEPQKAVPMLQESERELPDDYNPPARLAVAYLAMGQPQKALAASQRAEKKVYGPRTISVLMTEAKAYAALGDKASAGRVLDQAEQRARQFSDVQGGPRLQKYVRSLREHLLGPQGQKPAGS